jgi:predicted HAD superfamily hydrolase
MIAQMEKVMQKVSTLPINQQTDIAYFWEQDLEGEIEFDAKIAQTVGELSDLASKALADFADGKTLKIGFDKL